MDVIAPLFFLNYCIARAAPKPCAQPTLNNHTHIVTCKLVVFSVGASHLCGETSVLFAFPSFRHASSFFFAHFFFVWFTINCFCSRVKDERVAKDLE